MPSPRHILLLEKNSEIIRFIHDIAGRHGYDVHSVGSYQEARKALMMYDIRIAIIAMDATEHAEAAVDSTVRAFIPTILLSAEESPELQTRLLKKNILDVLDKRSKTALRKISKHIRRIEKNRHLSVLIVDDSNTYRSYVTALLKGHRFQTLEAKNGNEAIALLEKNNTVSLVITDYGMPEMDGLELIKQLRQHYDKHHLPIIVVSSMEVKDVIVECLRNGANDYIHKNFEHEEFFIRIYQTLESLENIKELTRKTRLLEHYRETIDKNTMVSMTDTKGVITYISEAFEKTSGYSKQEVIGKTHALFRHPDMPNTFYEAMWEKLNSGKAWEGEVKNRRKNGDAYWVRLHIEHDRDSRGNLTGYSAIGHDITSKKNLELLTKELEERVAREVEKNRLQTAQMVGQSRLAQMGEMLSMIAHQWRQPLASISAVASTLTLDVMMDNYKKEFFEERLETISDLAQHLSLTINDFRGFFKINKEKEEVTWETLCEGSLSIIGPMLETERVSLVKAYGETAQVETYANEVRQVLLNIFKNAEDIFLEKRLDDAEITIKSFDDGDFSYITVSDNAGGIDEKHLEKIFDPYFSTKKKKDGTGLGLYMSKTIIEEHCKGVLTVKNGQKGAVFTIGLPLSKAES